MMIEKENDDLQYEQGGIRYFQYAKLFISLP